MHVAFPFGFDGRGRTASASDEDHLRDMIELVLFTSPGERPFRPTFGSGLLGLVFGPNGDALAGTAQLSAQGALQQWLGELIQVEEVAVEVDDATLRVAVRYIARRGGQRRVASFTRARP
jgi:phage baseplate assembly protein W